MPFASLDGLTFRLNPSSIDWGYQIYTNVEETIGGRVVQVVGASLSDITLSGEYGERKGYRYHDRPDRALSGKGLLSWELAEAFLLKVRNMMEKQSEDSTEHGRMNKPLDFKFPEYGWHFGVYVKGIDDGQSNAAIRHSTGAFAYKWRLSLFIVEERSSRLVIPGKGSTTAERQKAAAINGYISRIANGVGWKPTQYNQPAIEKAVTGNSAESTAARAAGASGTRSGGVQE